ncbi:hypothetical protein GOBAR_AA23258 [Gossypium barbadense]|uniref:Uncharacterized protein n=1 Tax=Gossypium barbadense TaxID=3634 RepID=A0A2P5X258_GOSBA|nr:hypothetical protein GOBAR_AA23258 [Gossypium barbadense]
MFSKFISVSKTHFQNIETALKNQQASIQGLETQIGQLSKLIFERPKGSLPSNTEPNPKEQLNAINIQNDEGVVEPELEPRQETVVSKGRDEVDQNTNKPVIVEYKPRELTLCVGDETITLQAHNSGITSNVEGHIHEERRLRIEELDEWLAYKLRTNDKLKLRQNKPNTSPNQLKVGNKVLLDVVDPHIVTTTPNEEIPLTVLSIFPFGMVEVSHPKFGTFKHTRPGTRACLKPWPSRGRDTAMRYDRVEVGHDFPKTRDVINPHGRATWPYIMSSSRGKKAMVPSSKRRRGLGSFSVRAIAKVRHPFLEFLQASQKELFQIVHARPLTTGGLVRAMSVPEFGVTLGLYTDEFMEEEDMNALPRNIHILPSLCWKALAPLSSTYNPSRSKASALAPSLRYLHAILAHTLTGRRESTDVVNTHDAYYLWCMANAHVTDLAYFIAFAIRHQTE